MPQKPASAVSPIRRRPEPAKPPVLMERTQPVIERLSAALGEPVFTYWNSTKGAICQNDVAGLYALVRSRGQVDRLSLFIKSDGGSGQAARPGIAGRAFPPDAVSIRSGRGRAGLPGRRPDPAGPA